MSEEIDNIYKFAGTIPEKIEADRRRDLLDVITSWGGDFSTMSKKDDYKLLRQCREEIIDNEEEEVDSRVQIGIFKEIDCIWKTVNQSLELTTFDPKTGQILRNKIYWEEFGSDIESVALASPVPNVFVEEVNYILVVATAVEIRILAVIFNPFETIHIEPTEYYISTENVTITKIQSTKKGRIFLAGDDGNLYELSYHNEESFWSSRTKCRKLNLTQSVFSSFVPSFFKLSSSDSLIDICVDNDRNLLYTLSFNSKIQLYDLGIDGKSLDVVSSISNLKKLVEKLYPSANASDLNVASLATISKEDSHAVHLIATTETGFRLYFTTFSDPKAQSNKSYREIGAHSLKLLHVRAPSRKLNNVYASYYFPGNICVLTDTYGLHFHWIFDSALKKNQEQKEFIPIKEIWNFAFVEGDQSRYKEVATQQRTEQTRFCFVTGSRFYLVEKIRPIDEIETASFAEISTNYPNEELYSFLFIVGKSKNIQKRSFEPRDQTMGAELYIARKLTPYWNIPIFIESEGNWTVNPIFQSANNFKDENYQSIISKLNYKSASEIQTKFLLLDCCQEILIFAEILIPNIGLILDNADFSISTISSISFARFFSDKKFLIFFKELASVIISKLNEKEGEGFLHRLENLPNLFTQFDKKYYSILEVLLQSSKRNQSEVKFALQNIISMMTSPDQCARIRSSLQKICVELFVLEYFDGIIDLILALCHTIDPHKYSHKYFDNEQNDHLVKDIFHQLEEFYQLLIAVLSKLFEQNSKYFAQVLHKMLNVDELPLSYLVFHWLIKTNLMEQLFANDNSIKIPHLENFLICYHPELLENFYNANNQFEKTAQFFFDKYQEESNQQPLTERIKYLEQSLKYAILANSNLEIVIQQYLRVASIQLEIYDILEKNKDKISFDTSDLLTSNFSISDLYHNYAVQFQLSAIQLKIIRVNDVADETTRATVKEIWHFILKHYNTIPLNGLQLFDADYVLDAINQLYPSPTTLPLDEICFYRFKKNEIEKEFIEKVLIRSNVPYEEIFRIYHQKTMRTENPKMIYFLMNSQKDLKIEKLVPFRSNIRQYKELCKDDKDLFQKFTQLDQHIQSVFV